MLRRLALFLLALSLYAQAQAKQPFTFEDMMQLKRVGEPAVSPDSKWVAFSAVDVSLESAASEGTGRVGDEVRLSPLTHYGAFKVCNEQNARVYWLDHGVSSVGLRPWTVYGIGRDFGVTSEPTRAIEAVAARAGVEMPLCAMVYRVLYEKLPAKDAVRALMRRPIQAEAE